MMTQMLMGAGGPTVILQAAAYTSTTDIYSCRFNLETDGWVWVRDGISTVDTQRYQWLIGGSTSDYEALATIVTGTFSTGTAGTWLDLATVAIWGRYSVTLGPKLTQVTFDLSIRAKANPAITLVTSRITLTSDRP